MTSPLLEQLQQTLGDGFTFEREIPGAGMSHVFVAHEKSLGRQVVVKVLPPELASAVSADRFRREIQLAASLQHPHIVPVLVSGVADGLPYYTMPYQVGESLRDRIAREGPLPIRDVITITREVAQALAYAHERGVVHRDIKPDNIILTSGVAMVADFGIAKALRNSGETSSITATGVILGTPAYMAPEQAAGDAASDQRADVYALGIVAYEMLCGRSPFAGRNLQQTLVAHAVEAPKPVMECRPDTPPSLARLVTQCMEKDPARRVASAADIVRALDAPSTVSPPVSTGRHRLLVLAIGAAAILLVTLGARYIILRTSSAPAPSVGHSIAVLRFANTGGDKQDEYFASGMAEELMTQLAKVPGLRVAALSSSFSFTDENPDVKDVGRKLNVATVLEGSVRRAGNRMRVSARLVDVSTGYQLWADEYQRDPTDVFAVQDELTRDIVGALQLKLAAGAVGNASRGTTNVDAYNLYLRGRFFYEKRNEASLVKAAEYFKQAIAIDSMYAPAYSGLADSYAFLTAFGFRPPRALMPLATAAAERAIALDSTLPEAYTSRGFIAQWYDWNYTLADSMYNRALALNPDYAPARLFHAWTYVALNRIPDALAEIRRARDADPLSLIYNTRYASMLKYARQYEASEKQARYTLSLDSTYALAWTERSVNDVLLHRCPYAISDAMRGHVADNGHDSGALGVAAATCGDTAVARQQLNRQLAERDSIYAPPTVVAQLYLALGDVPHALDWLDRGYEQRDWQMYLLKAEPLYDGIRNEPRFKALVTKMHLP